MIIVGLLIALVVAFGLVVLGMGLLVLWGSGGNLWELWVAFVLALRSRRWAETQGTVTRSVVTHRQWRRRLHYAAAIRYSYSVAGKTFFGERVDFDRSHDETFDGAHAVVERLQVGSAQRVFYDPGAPNRCTLARSVPSVFWVSLGWLVVTLVGVAVAGLGVDVVFGAFEKPPELGELPTMRAQVGGLLVGCGALALCTAGIRALLERKTRGILRFLAAAKSVRAGELKAGERVAVYGRAEDEAPGEPAGTELPFGERATFYLHTDLGTADGSLTQTTSFIVRDETGAVNVELDPSHSLLCSHDVPIRADVQDWLDRHDLELGRSVSADRRATLKIERVGEGDSVLVVGQAMRASARRVVLRAHADDPLSLLLADVPLPALIKKLTRTTLITLALCGGGAVALLCGAIALVS